MRVELPAKVNGTAQYSIDVQLPGMLYGAVLRSPAEGGAPMAIDDAAARAIPACCESSGCPSAWVSWPRRRGPRSARRTR
jgi:hypothetical protein